MLSSDSDIPVNDMWQTFKDELHLGLERNVPSKMTKPVAKTPWVTRNIRIYINKLKKLYQKQRGCALESKASQHYRRMKARLQSCIRKAYWVHIEGIIASSEYNDNVMCANKNFWQFIKYRRQDFHGIAPLKFNGLIIDAPKAKASILNKQFQSIFSSRSPLALKLLCTLQLRFVTAYCENNPTMENFDITNEGVHKLQGIQYK